MTVHSTSDQGSCCIVSTSCGAGVKPGRLVHEPPLQTLSNEPMGSTQTNELFGSQWLLASVWCAGGNGWGETSASWYSLTLIKSVDSVSFPVDIPHSSTLRDIIRQSQKLQTKHHRVKMIELDWIGRFLNWSHSQNEGVYLGIDDSGSSLEDTLSCRGWQGAVLLQTTSWASRSGDDTTHWWISTKYNR